MHKVLPVSLGGVLALPVDPGVVGMRQARGDAFELHFLLLDAFHRTRNLGPFRRNLDLKSKDICDQCLMSFLKMDNPRPLFIVYPRSFQTNITIFTTTYVRGLSK